MLYLFQKHTLFLGGGGSRSTLSIAIELLLFRLNFGVLLEFPFFFVKNSVVSKKLHSPAGYEKSVFVR